MLDRVAYVLDGIVWLLSPLLPGLKGGGVFRWEGQPLSRFEVDVQPRAAFLRGFGLEMVLDRQAPRQAR